MSSDNGHGKVFLPLCSWVLREGKTEHGELIA
jgi:hypothetical protein